LFKLIKLWEPGWLKKPLTKITHWSMFMKKINGLIIALSLFISPAFAAEQKVIVEMHKGGAHTLITSKDHSSYNVPVAYQERVNTLLKKGTIIEDVEFTPDNGWMILTRNNHYAEGIAGNFVKTLQSLQSRGIKINAVAFNPNGWETNHGYVIVYDGGYKAENIPASLTAKLDEYVGEKAKLKSVEFTPNGGWSILTDVSTWSRIQEDPSVKVSYLDYMKTLYHNNHEVFASAFNPDNYGKNFGWLVVEDDAYTGHYIPEGLQTALQKMGFHNGQNPNHQPGGTEN
jgi:hypothetical protein